MIGVCGERIQKQGVKAKGEFNETGRLENKVQKQGHTQEIQDGANPSQQEYRNGSEPGNLIHIKHQEEPKLKGQGQTHTSQNLQGQGRHTA